MWIREARGIYGGETGWQILSAVLLFFVVFFGMYVIVDRRGGIVALGEFGVERWRVMEWSVEIFLGDVLWMLFLDGGVSETDTHTELG